MTPKDEAKILKVIRLWMNHRMQDMDRTNCPDEEVLASYIDNVLSGKARSAVENHLANCTFCREEFSAAYKSAQSLEAANVLPRILERAKSFFQGGQPRRSLLEIEIRLTETALELIGSTGRLIAPPAMEPFLLRGPQASAATGFVQVEEEMGRFKVVVQVERIENDLCEIGVRVTGIHDRPAEGVRVDLLSGSREQASYLTRQGRVVFDHIPKGKYNLTVSEAGVPVGTVRLSIG